MAGVGTLVLAPWTLEFGEAVGDVQPLVNAQVGSATLVGEGSGVALGGGVVAGEAAIVTTAAGTARPARPNLCHFTSFSPDARFVALRVPRGTDERHPARAAEAPWQPAR